MPNRKLIEKLTSNFSFQSPEIFLSCLAEDVIWKIVGTHTAYCKKDVSRTLEVFSNFEMKEAVVKDIIVEGDTASVTGTLQMKSPDESYFRMLEYSDYYRMKDGQIVEIVSFSNQMGHLDALLTRTAIAV